MSDTDMDVRLREIEKNMARVLVLLEGLSDKMAEEQARDGAWRDDMDKVMYGDGNGLKGLLVRLDRLEQDREREKWWRRTGAVALVGMVANMLYGILV